MSCPPISPFLSLVPPPSVHATNPRFVELNATHLHADHSAEISFSRKMKSCRLPEQALTLSVSSRVCTPVHTPTRHSVGFVVDCVSAKCKQKSGRCHQHQHGCPSPAPRLPLSSADSRDAVRPLSAEPSYTCPLIRTANN